MKIFKRISTIAMLAGLLFTAVSCGEKDLYDQDAVDLKNQKPVVEANTFNFSTVQNVKLSVDYSSFETYGPVFFSVYSENPFVGEGEEEHLDESIAPVFEDYTGSDGKFNRTVKLPAYAQRLYVVTGNFFVSDRLIETVVTNGVAKAVATQPAMARGIARSATRGVQTNDLNDMPQLSFIVDDDGNSTGERIYKDWLTPLGTWDSKSGAPNYLIRKGTVRDELVCSAEEIAGLFSAVGEALDANKACNEEYRNHADLTLEKESEVTITMLGGSTCWNSSLGYYYYKEDEQPRDPLDLNIIMLFPNTQDGHWARMKKNYSYNGNIGVKRGDAVQLMYYPHIADNGDLSDATTIFPKGIKIGFILKANAWAMQGEDYGILGLNYSNRMYNVWGTSTNGASYCRVSASASKDVYKFPNDNQESRSAKFAYVSPNNDKYAIISFEDACNDQDYDDVIFALKPVNAFTPLPEIEDRKTTTVGVYAFEDLWPARGDYDLNDAVVDFKHEKVMSKLSTESDFKIYQESFYLTTYQNYVTLTSGLALTLNTPVEPSSIVMKKIPRGATKPVEAEFVQDGNVFYLTENFKGELGTTYILTINYSDGQTSDELASVQPFIFRNEKSGKTWEVHIPFEAPTARMNLSYFGTEDDSSVPAENKYFVRGGDYPFAFFLYGAKIDSFKETILKRENESRKIDEFFPDFMEWSLSRGARKTGWYLDPEF